MSEITAERKVELQLNSVFEMVNTKEEKHDVDLQDIKNRLGRLSYILNEDVFNN